MHKIRYVPRMLRDLWWWIRGVGVSDYRACCTRCGRTGQVHWTVRGCRRFVRASKVSL